MVLPNPVVLLFKDQCLRDTGRTMASKGRRGRKEPDLPDWALELWKQAGEPDIYAHQDVFSGPLLDRRVGLRRDDLVEVLLDARALLKDAEPWIRGRLLGTNKNSFEILTDDGRYHHVARDVIVELVLVAHLRPPYIDDRELMEFEREDAKRRNRIHEEVDKGGDSGRDDSHVWG